MPEENQSAACQVCSYLWKELSRATTAHVELIKQQEHLAKDAPLHQALEDQIQAASARRSTAQDAIKLHMALEHSRSRAAGAR